MKCRSEWHRPAATVRTSTSWGPGASTWTSRMTSSPGAASRTAARMGRPYDVVPTVARARWAGDRPRRLACLPRHRRLAGDVPRAPPVDAGHREGEAGPGRPREPLVALDPAPHHPWPHHG